MMTVNINKVKGRMRELNMTQVDVAEAMSGDGVQMCVASLKNRFAGKVEFKLSEFIELMKVLEVEDAGAYITE